MKENEITPSKEVRKPKKALFIFAHADDAEQFAGGTAVQLAAQGIQTVVVDMTNGNRGTKEHTAEYLSAIRHEEARKASEILRAKERINLGLDDSFLQVDHRTLLRMIDLIREQDPDVVFTHARSDHHHEDHSTTATLTTLAVRMASFNNLETKHPPTTKRIDVFYSDTQYSTDPSGQFAPLGVFVSLDDEARSRKEQAFLAHVSQNLTSTPGEKKGNLTHLEMTKTMEALRGLQIRKRAAEAFTQLVDNDHPPVPAEYHPLVTMLPGQVYILPHGNTA